MKHSMILLFCYLFICGNISVMAQKKQSAQQMLEDAKKQISGDKEMDPALKEQMLKLMNSPAVKKSMNSNDPKIRNAMMAEDKLQTIPAPDTKRMAMIPAKPFNREQLESFLKSMAIKIQAQLDNEAKTRSKSIIDKAKGSSLYLSTEAVVAWYNGMPEQALFLAATAAGLPDNINALNNLGAMLNIHGYEEKAVPVLEYAKLQDPANSSVLNNLGRAWLGLGDKKKAETIFLTCIQNAPHHPEANNSLGCLYEEQGNKSKAREHFKKSLEGSYNEEAAGHLEKLDPGFELVFDIQKNHKVPEYFNQFQFQVPEELYNKADYFKVKGIHEAFRKGISDLQNQYNAKRQISEEKGGEEIQASQRRRMNALSSGTMPQNTTIKVYPFAAISARMIIPLELYYVETSERFKKNYQKDISDLQERRSRALKDIKKKYESLREFGTMGEFTGCLNCNELGPKECKEMEKANNEFQMEAASIHKEFVDKYRLLITGQFDNMVYWYSLLGPTKHLADAAFYKCITGFFK